MAEPKSIYQGDTGGPWNLGRKLSDGTVATLTDDDTCRLVVPGTDIDRPVTAKTADNKRWIVALTPAETGVLALGGYSAVAELANPTLTPAFLVEEHIPFVIVEQADAPAAADLVIEDGSGKADAACFSAISVTDTYWSDRDDAIWAKATMKQKRAAKRKAADYLSYGYRWLGQPVKLEQALCFPRSGMVDPYGNLLPHTVIPEPIKTAEHLLAREALSIDIMSQTDPSKLVKSESVSIGGISESKTYELGNRRPLAMHTFTHIDAVLQGYMSGSVGRSGFRSVPLRPA